MVVDSGPYDLAVIPLKCGEIYSLQSGDVCTFVSAHRNSDGYKAGMQSTLVIRFAGYCSEKGKKPNRINTRALKI